MKTVVSCLAFCLMWCIPISLAFGDIGFVFAIGVVWLLFNFLVFRESDPCSYYLKLFLLPLSAFVGNIPGAGYCVATIAISLLLLPIVASFMYYSAMLFDPVSKMPWIENLIIICLLSSSLYWVSTSFSVGKQFNSMRQMVRIHSLKSIDVLCNTVLLYLTIGLVISEKPNAFLFFKPKFTVVNPFQLDEKQLETVQWLDLYQYAGNTIQNRMPILFYGIIVNADGSRLNHPAYKVNQLDLDSAYFREVIKNLGGEATPLSDNRGKIECYVHGKAFLVQPLDSGYVYRASDSLWNPVSEDFPNAAFFYSINYRSPYFYVGDKDHPYIFTMEKKTAD